MKKWIKVTIVVIIFLVIGIVWFLHMSTRPMYKIGDVRKMSETTSTLIPPMQSSGEDYFRVEDDIKLSYFARGVGENVLVLHGGPGIPHENCWSGLEGITDQYRFIYYDQRGCGNSTRPINTFSSTNYYANMKELELKLGLTAQIADIERIRKILGEDKLTIIGHSFGGFIASLYAAEFPEHVDKLILVAPANVLKLPSDNADIFSNIREALQGDERESFMEFENRYFDYKNIFSYSDADLVELNNEFSYYYNLASMGSVNEFIVEESTGGWMVQALYLSMGSRHNYIENFPDTEISPLIIHAGDDFVQNEAATKLYTGIFPLANYVVIPNAGHHAFEDEAKQFEEIIEQYLSDELN